jgi:hypothetical protein
MRIHFSPTQDASLYEEYSWRNTGLDEIIEVGKDDTGTKRVRSLVMFDTADISRSFSEGRIPANAKFDLNLFVARADDLRNGQQILLQAVSESWVEGTGYFYQNTNVPYSASRDPSGGYTENDGATWKNRQSGSIWATTGSQGTGLTVSKSIDSPVKNLNIDVTDLVLSWVSGTVPNNGCLLKFDDAAELDTKNAGNVRFFSRNSHTIHLPTLSAKWDNQTYLTGSMSASDASDVIVMPRNLKPKYKIGEMVRVTLSVRERYPQKTFDTVYSAFAGNKRLPITSYFSIVDQQSNTVVVPFDDFSKISCDGTTNYFDFKVHSMYSGRYYKVMFKVVDNGFEHIIDNGYLFTVENI